MTEPETMASAMQDTARMWWLWLVAGIGWVIFSVIVLQFDTQSVAAVGSNFRLVLLGAEDRMAPAEAGRKMAEAIPGATLTVIAGCGHMMMLEKPDQTLDALMAVL